MLTVYNSDGEEIASHDDIETEAGDRFSMLEFSPDSSGVYYISASGLIRERTTVGRMKLPCLTNRMTTLILPYGPPRGRAVPGHT